MIYLDNTASTRPYDEVIEYLTWTLSEYYANPSAIHNYGYKTSKMIKDSQTKLCEYLGCSPNEIIYTSGGTESNNFAIINGAFANENITGKHVITTVIEHSSVKKSFEFLESKGFEVTYLPVDNRGVVKLDELKRSLRKDTALVSIMAVNNEIGTINPIKEIGEIIKEFNKKILFHVDGIQSFMKIDVDLTNVDLYSTSGHKFHATKGIGFLMNRSKRLSPFIVGGGQQNNMRSGTVNMPLIVAMNKAFEIRQNRWIEIKDKVHTIKKYFLEKLTKLDNYRVNSPMDSSSNYICSVTIFGVSAEVLLRGLENSKYNIIASAGASCSSKAKLASSTIAHIGGSPIEANSTIRFSFNEFLTMEDIDKTVEVLLEEVKKLRLLDRK